MLIHSLYFAFLSSRARRVRVHLQGHPRGVSNTALYIGAQGDLSLSLALSLSIYIYMEYCIQGIYTTHLEQRMQRCNMCRWVAVKERMQEDASSVRHVSLGCCPTEDAPLGCNASTGHATLGCTCNVA